MVFYLQLPLRDQFLFWTFGPASCKYSSGSFGIRCDSHSESMLCWSKSWTAHWFGTEGTCQKPSYLRPRSQLSEGRPGKYSLLGWHEPFLDSCEQLLFLFRQLTSIVSKLYPIISNVYHVMLSPFLSTWLSPFKYHITMFGWLYVHIFGVKTPNICLTDKVVDLTVVLCLRGNQFFSWQRGGSCKCLFPSGNFKVLVCLKIRYPYINLLFPNDDASLGVYGIPNFQAHTSVISWLMMRYPNLWWYPLVI